MLVPLANYLSPSIYELHSQTSLLSLSVAISIVLLMLYDVNAFPGIFVGLFLYYSLTLEPDSALVLSTWYIFSLTICWLAYRSQVERWYFEKKVLVFDRYKIICLVVIFPLILLLGVQILINFALLPNMLGLVHGDCLTLKLLLSYESFLLGGLAATQPIYYFLQIVLRNRFVNTLKYLVKKEISHNVSWYEVILWLFVLLAMFIVIRKNYNEILLNHHSLSFFLPIILYGSIRFGFIIISFVWIIFIWFLLINYQGVIDYYYHYQNLIFLLSLLIMFTITIVVVAISSTRQRLMNSKARYLSLSDPLTGLPNLRWLVRDLVLHDESTICFIRMANLDIFSRAYGIQLRIQLKQQIYKQLKRFLSSNERLYQLPDYDLVLRLNTMDIETKIHDINNVLREFRLLWNGMPVHPNYGIGYGEVVAPVKHINILLAELSSIAEESLQCGTPQNADLQSGQLQSHMYKKTKLIQQIQHALDGDGFILTTEPVIGIRGDKYYEIAVYLADQSREIVTTEALQSVIKEFGLCYEVDYWVLKRTIQFINESRYRLPSLRFIVNVFIESFYRPSLFNDISSLLNEYKIEPYQLTLQVLQAHLLQQNTQAMLTIAQLRYLGCRIVIDGFSFGYTNAKPFKDLYADFVKIDGRLINGQGNSEIGYCIVTSMCQIARLKKMSVIAHSVNNEEQCEILKNLGVDYLQGELLGESVPLKGL